MGKEVKMILEQDNDELAGYFEAFLEDFKAISTEMLAAINVDRGATLKIPDAEYNRLKRLGEALDALAKRKFNIENAPDFKPVVDALGRVQSSIDNFKFPDRIPVDMPSMEHNLATPEIDLKPVTQSIEKLERLFLSGLGVRITNFDEMPLVFDKVTGATGGGVSSEVIVTQSALPTGAATNAKLDDVITAINAIPGGGGVQYTEGDTDATITGTAMLFEGAADTLKVPSTTNPLPVNFTNASLDVNINAGTNAIGKLAANDGIDIGDVTINNASIAVTGTFWQATQPVSAASLPLPSGASTAAKQPALGTAGTASTDVITIQGIASMTPVQVGDNSGSLTVDAPVGTPVFVRLSDGSSAISTLPVSLASVPSHAVTNAGTFAVQESGTHVQVDDAAFTPATSKVMMIGAEFDNVSPDSVDEGDGGAVRMSANRNLFVNIRDAAGNERGLNIDASGQLAVTLASAQTLATVTTVSTVTNITNWGNIVDNAAFTDGTTRLMMSGYIYDETAGTGLTENDGAAARVDAKRAQVMVIEDVSTRGTTNRLAITTRLAALVEGPTAADAAIAAAPMTVGGRASDAVPSAMSADGDVVNSWMGRRGETIVSIEPKAFGGCSIYRTLDLDETEEDVKTSAGTLYGYFIFNAAATTRYVKVYNATAANVTVGSTTPVLTIPIPAGAAANVEFSTGIAFSTAICIAATTGVADADTGAPAANDVIMNVFYK